jgi:hypothetical protein
VKTTEIQKQEEKQRQLTKLQMKTSLALKQAPKESALKITEKTTSIPRKVSPSTPKLKLKLGIPKMKAKVEAKKKEKLLPSPIQASVSYLLYGKVTPPKKTKEAWEKKNVLCSY